MRLCAKLAIELLGPDVQGAVVVAEHHVVPEAGEGSPCTHTPFPKKGRKNSSAITRSGPSQYGCEPCKDRVPGVAVEAPVDVELATNW